MKLHLGCGPIILEGEGWVNLDKDDKQEHCATLLGIPPPKGIVKIELEDPLPYSDNTVDIIVICTTLWGIKKKRELLEEIHRVLKPNGDFRLQADSDRFYLDKCPTGYESYGLVSRKTLMGWVNEIGFREVKEQGENKTGIGDKTVLESGRFHNNYFVLEMKK